MDDVDIGDAASQFGQPAVLKWMWGDAQLLNLPGMGLLARANPLRWSAGNAVDVRAELVDLQHKSRPLRMRVKGRGQQEELMFANPAQAVEWIDWVLKADANDDNHATHELGSYPIPSASPALAIAMQWLSVPGLALYLRYKAAGTGLPWTQRNVFQAYSYASQVVKYPRQVAEQQSSKQVQIVWSAFFSDPDASLIPFIDEVQRLESERGASVLIGEATWNRFHPHQSVLFLDDYFMVWQRDETVVVALRGGDATGRPDDMTRHPGSPVRAFMQGVPADKVPEAVEQHFFPALDALLALGGLKIHIVAYSQGAIAAVAAAKRYGAKLSKVTIFNGAMMFYAPWLEKIESCGAEVPVVFNSWVVEGDPLSDGIRGSYVAPRISSPGTTYLLPTRGSGFDNHYLHHFTTAKRKE